MTPLTILIKLYRIITTILKTNNYTSTMIFGKRDFPNPTSELIRKTILRGEI